MSAWTSEFEWPLFLCLLFCQCHLLFQCCLLYPLYFSPILFYLSLSFTVLFSLPVLPALSWPEKYQPLHSSEIIGNSAVIKRLRAWLLEWKQCLDKEAKRAKLMMIKEKKKSHKEEGKCSNRLFSSWVFCRWKFCFKLDTFYVSDFLIDKE